MTYLLSPVLLELPVAVAMVEYRVKGGSPECYRIVLIMSLPENKYWKSEDAMKISRVGALVLTQQISRGCGNKVRYGVTKQWFWKATTSSLYCHFSWWQYSCHKHSNKDSSVSSKITSVLCAQINVAIFTFRNALDHPDVEQYHKIRTGNKVFSQRVWRHSPAQQFLLSIGWVVVSIAIHTLEPWYHGW